MHRLIALAILLWGTAHAQAPTIPANPAFAQARFMIACRLSELDCSGLAAPLIVAIDGYPNGSMGHHYWKTNIVFVTTRCLLDVADFTKCDGVVIHEIVHYIYSMQKNAQPNRCVSEALAWDVYNAYVLEVGRSDLVRTNWKDSYPQCAKSHPSSTSSDTQ